MSVQTTYLRPEDDPTLWFTRYGAEGVEGPAVITALAAKEWFLEKDKERRQFSAGTLVMEKLFVPPGWKLMGYKDALVSGYYVPK